VDIKVHTERDAKDLNLIQLYIWLHEEEYKWVIDEYKRISRNKKRMVMIVRKNGCMYTLFVDDIALKETKKD